MGWVMVVVLNAIISGCYLGIVFHIVRGLLATGQMRTNPLAVATAAIFTTCAVHHGHHALHLTGVGVADQQVLVGMRNVFGEWHSVLVDLLGAVVAITYLGLRRTYRGLLNTPAMFEDAVRAATEERLRVASVTDQLTGLPNRAAFEAFKDELPDAAEGLTVLFIDLDGFKAVNDAHGHDAGDRLLHDLAQRVLRSVGPGEQVFRFGGDEFVVIARHDAAGDVADLVERVRLLLCAPVHVRDGDVQVGASIGVAVGRVHEGLDALLRRADALMYAQKRDTVLGILPPPRRPLTPKRVDLT